MKSVRIMTISVFALGLMLCLAKVSEATPMGTAWTYQGRLMDANEPANGIYEFQFKLYDLPEDGNQLDGTPAFRGVEVVDGYFTLQLDFGSNVFDGDARWLEINVRSGNNPSDPFTILDPRQEITPTPYALQTRGLFVDSALNVGIGTTSPVATLDVTNPGGRTAISGKSPWIGVYGIHNSTTGSFPGVLGETDSLNSAASGVRGRVTSTTPGSLSAGVWGMNTGTGSNGVGVRGSHDGSGRGVWGYTASSSGYAGYFTGGQNYFEGKVGIGTLTPADLLHVSQDTTGSMGIRITNTEASGRDYALRVGGANSAIGAGSLAIYDHTASTSRLTVASNGYVGIAITNPSSRLQVHGTVYSSSGGFKFPDETVQTTAAGSGAAYWKKLGDSIVNTNPSNVGIGVAIPTAKLTVGGNILVDAADARVTTPILEITGGSDLSEQFQIRSDNVGVTASAGMVVSIDPENPGSLVVSNKAYDRTVAGIISGAGGIKTGMLMGQKGSSADGANPVALTGRVYCLADASTGPIEPGDLLTTSQTPGHAMKVKDYAKAQGAILGKAMSSLSEGRGLVLVLVTLQ